MHFDAHDVHPVSAWLQEIQRFEKDGELFKAYDIALQGLRQHPHDAWLAHRAVLCLANAGASDLARQKFDDWRLAARQETDFLTLDARLHKDLAEKCTGAMREQHINLARSRYAQAYAAALATGSGNAYYPGINLATLHLLADQRDEAIAIGREVLAQIMPRVEASSLQNHDDAYWLTATAIEALLIVGELAAAKTLVPLALRTNQDNYAALASTARQLRRVVSALGLEALWLDAFAPPRVVHYTGHMLARPGQLGRLHHDDEAAMTHEIDRVLAQTRIGAAYGSLAAGADILFAEAFLARGISLNIVLPFALAEFIETSVRSAGESWVARFERCLRLATTVRYATEDQYLGDDHLFVYCSQLAMGLAALCARHLYADVHQYAIWDGQLPRHEAGTAVDLGIWWRKRLPQTVIACRDIPPADLADVGKPRLGRSGRGSRAMLFGDIKGFSKLTDWQIPVFAEVVLGTLGQVIAARTEHIASVNTWGDALYIVCHDAGAAADCALALQDAMRSIDFAAVGLPSRFALRIGGHVGPVYEVHDPITRRIGYMGSHVSRAARIEPIAPEDCVYVTETFAAILALHNSEAFVCDYVGMTEMAKQYGSMRMFLLKRARGNDATTMAREIR